MSKILGLLLDDAAELRAWFLAPVLERLNRIERKLSIIYLTEKEDLAMSQDLQNAINELAAQAADISSAVDANATVVDKIVELLNDNADDPAQVRAIAAQLAAARDKLAASTAKGTAAEGDSQTGIPADPGSTTPVDTTPAPVDTTPAPVDTTPAPVDGTPTSPSEPAPDTGSVPSGDDASAAPASDVPTSDPSSADASSAGSSDSSSAPVDPATVPTDETAPSSN